LKYIYFGLLSSLYYCINQHQIAQIIYNIYLTFRNMRGFSHTWLKHSSPASSRLLFMAGSHFKPSLGLSKGSTSPSCPLHEQRTMRWAMLHHLGAQHRSGPVGSCAEPGQLKLLRPLGPTRPSPALGLSLGSQRAAGTAARPSCSGCFPKAFWSWELR